MNLKSSYWPIFRQLLATDFTVFMKLVKDRLINLVIWIVSATLINRYLLPSFGVSQAYGAFILVGICASVGLFEVFPNVMNLITDLEGDRIISYYLTLPLPAWLVFVRLVIYYAITSGLLGLMVLPMGKLLLGNELSLQALMNPAFFIVFALINLFYGAFTLWIASRVPSTLKIGNVWMRFVYPLWVLGGFQFTWSALYTLIPSFALLNLLNPMTYVMEGMRATILGQKGYLPWWLCALMLLLFTVLYSWHGIYRLRKRLDSL